MLIKHHNFMSIFKLLSSVDKFYYLNSSLLSKYAMQPAEEEKKFKIEKEYSPKELESINQKKIKLINLNNSFFKDLKAKLLDLHSRKCLVENVDRGKEILPEKEECKNKTCTTKQEIPTIC